MIYYSLSALMLARIKEILIISTPDDISSYKKLLKDGKQWGLNFQYAVQTVPKGLADAFIIGEDFLQNDAVALILGDNIFYGHGFPKILKSAKDIVRTQNKAVVFGYNVSDPERYGIIELDTNGNPVSIEEKPKNPKSNYAVVGLYFYPNSVINIAKNVKPSGRGELEITNVNKHYLKYNALKFKLLGRGFAWLDTGTFKSLTDAGQFIETLETRQNMQIACPEEIAYKLGYISKEELKEIANKIVNNSYGQYLLRLIN